ncbi:MAG TPA: hypothetical protein DEF41_14705 [Desulfovibrio sp.]|uniref:Uncharacterized protein n=1 Tax=Nitratidesulfovibrio vulgaris (strain ATCC 29579 / DSM 644 / CCUG 34227 / NCIMB 8303 / VKM B-1760 / Hildenborough) TaxID=882 RepID=Q729E5_NITV2|nr:hypothetical protein DVU_2406 [Nitratidesulfovibrio vulgaris str. Hildenborough]HBW17329.1 hypothetical protein [Desulfovibrio sp.]
MVFFCFVSVVWAACRLKRNTGRVAHAPKDTANHVILMYNCMYFMENSVWPLPCLDDGEECSRGSRTPR